MVSDAVDWLMSSSLPAAEKLSLRATRVKSGDTGRRSLMLNPESRCYPPPGHFKRFIEVAKKAEAVETEKGADNAVKKIARKEIRRVTLP
jgi:hypothetical protein